MAERELMLQEIHAELVAVRGVQLVHGERLARIDQTLEELRDAAREALRPASFSRRGPDA